MKIFLTDQKSNFPRHLERLKSCPPIPYTENLLKHKIGIKVISNHQHLSPLDAESLFNYRIFPESILQAYPQWRHENREMKVGDTIVQQIYIPPFPRFSQKIIAGVRIKEIFNTEARKGFSYETLKGHPEKGVSVFSLEQQDSTLVFKIETYSSASGKFLSLFQPLSAFYQAYCTKKALENVATLSIDANRTDTH
jgi:hypothetical protein